MDKELIEMLLNDKDFRKDAVEDIRRMMDEEMAKSPHKRDYPKIAQLSHDYCELMGMTDEVEKTSATGIQEVLRNSRKLKIQPSKRTTRIFSILLVAAVLAVANTITVFAVNENIVSFIVNRAENGFSVTPVPETVIELPTSEDDPYGIRTECAKYGLDVEVPTYKMFSLLLTLVMLNCGITVVPVVAEETFDCEETIAEESITKLHSPMYHNFR